MGRRLALAVCLLACSLFGATAASGAPGRDSVRPQPPTSDEVQQETKRFLDSLPPERGPRAGAAGKTGGTEQGGDGLLFPENRVVAFYGAPQMGATIVGRKSLSAAKRRLRKQTRPYDVEGRQAIPGFDLVAVIATADRGGDGKYRTRQSNAVIERYLNAAEAIGGRLILDIQPARSTFIKEVRPLDKWLARPNVDIALDPEWNVGRKGVPGRTVGSVGAKTLNRVSGYMDLLCKQENLPQKALVIHQFRDGSVRERGKVEQRDKVDVTLNFDGIGGAAAKEAGYQRLTRDDLFAGFSLFYRLDSGLMSPSKVMRLDPSPNFVLYQ
ncbi:MAG: hypothetical protein ACRDL1_06340 [Solirubrobacterales bacterium]